MAKSTINITFKFKSRLHKLAAYFLIAIGVKLPPRIFIEVNNGTR